MKVHDHLMDDRWRDLKVSLHVRFGGSSAVDLRVGVDERQVLTLQFGEGCHRWNQDAQRFAANLRGPSRGRIPKLESWRSVGGQRAASGSAAELAVADQAR